MFEKINFDQWPRYNHFKIFSSMLDPYLALTSKVYIKPLMGKPQLFAKILFLIRETCEEIPEFAYRITSDGEVIKFKQLDIGFNILAKDELFSNHRVIAKYDFQEFANDVSAAIKTKSTHGKIEIDPNQDQNIIVTSYIPWFTFTGLKEPIMNKYDSIPRITWGKISEDGYLPISIQAHHGLIDGYHIGKFLDLLTRKITKTK